MNLLYFTSIHGPVENQTLGGCRRCGIGMYGDPEFRICSTISKKVSYIHVWPPVACNSYGIKHRFQRPLQLRRVSCGPLEVLAYFSSLVQLYCPIDLDSGRIRRGRLSRTMPTPQHYVPPHNRPSSDITYLNLNCTSHISSRQPDEGKR